MIKFLFRPNSLLLLTLGVAFGLRIWGLDFGLPYKFHPDEDKYVDVALNWHLRGEMNLEFINPPLFIYILAAAYTPWLAWSPFTPTDEWISGAYFFARLWSVVFAMLTLALTYRVTHYLSQFWNLKASFEIPKSKILYPRMGENPKSGAGLLAMGLLACLFLPIREAHFAVNDTAVTFFVLLAIYASLRLLSEPQLVMVLLAGFAVGLATATKLTGGLTILPLLMAHGLSSKKPKALNLAISLAIACATFLLIDAHIFWQWPLFVEAITQHLDFGMAGYKGLRMMPGSGWEFYFYTLHWGLGWPMTWLILVALVSVIFSETKRIRMVLLVLPIALFVYMGGQKIVFARFLLPAIPPLVILTAIKIDEWLKGTTKLRWLFIMIILLAQPLATSLWFDHLLTLPDTRQIATAWFSQTFPQNTAVVRESYSILPSKVLLNNDWPYKIKNLSASSQVETGLDRYLSNAQIVVLSSYTSDRTREDEDEDNLRRKQLALLDQEATLIKEFNPYATNYDDWFYLDQLYGSADETWFRTRPGPVLKIYRLNNYRFSEKD